MPRPEIPLYDDVNRWTFNQPKDIRPEFSMPNTKEGEQALRRYRIQLRRAERFYFEDDFMEKVLELSSDFKKIKNWANLARLPYDAMWIEFDCHKKVQWSRDQNTLRDMNVNWDEVPRRAGYLLETIDKETGAWACTPFFDRTQGQADIVPDVVSYFFAPEGPSHMVMNPPKPWDSTEFSSHGDDFRERMNAYAHIGLGITVSEKDKNTIVRVPEFENRIQYANEPLFHLALQKRAKTFHGMPDKMDRVEKLGHAVGKVVRMALQEDAGVFRWIIAALALMNAAPVVKHYFGPATGHRMKRGKDIPFMGHNLITLKLPKTKPLRYLTTLLNRASADRRKNRAHMVRGHFRQIEAGVLLPFKCKHEPTSVTHGVGYCLRCERQIKWIAPHQRGDAGVGWVNHDYVVEAA